MFHNFLSVTADLSQSYTLVMMSNDENTLLRISEWLIDNSVTTFVVSSIVEHQPQAVIADPSIVRKWIAWTVYFQNASDVALFKMSFYDPNKFQAWYLHPTSDHPVWLVEKHRQIKA